MSGYTSASSPQAAAAAAGWGRAGTILLQNKESRLPVYISPTERHVVLLLTPALPPDAVRGCDAAALQSDPFEALGRALASHCYSARHVPYMPRNGITALHVDHIRLATSIVFVITGPPCHGQPSQVGLAEVVRAICDDKPNIVVACCDIEELGPIGELFPTIIQVPDLSVPSLEAAASLVFQFADSSSVHQLSSYQKRGIGLSLHNFAVAELRRTKNVGHLQLGSTFPRLLYGVPTGSPAEEWFRRRGWPMRQTGPGTGQEVCDWLLGIDEWPSPGPLPLARWTFRRCNLDESARVYSVAERHLQTPAHTGWLHQYAQLAGTMNMSDVVLGTDEQGDIVAMAITYCRLTAGPLTDDLPWPTVLGDDVGGVTCMCVTGTVAPSTRDALMLGLLEHCVQVLKEQGMSRIFIDATKNGDGSFQSMGLQKWASYRDVWQLA
ncbi:hypothetical protein P8C59_007967 [Phyllachora maydis]|uniref:N-acetyltransferase domain-containing protein n=1 Tax=Phyllachora maydis TaxID=1825666 RepID=A0AAD9MG60_9PEZI|nr:hypothetical protein P8C59_007967 [Phyllachora maydis]